MNMNVTIKTTAGEDALLAVLADAGEDAKRAIAAISKNGLPTRRVEPWHYTDLRKLVTGYPAPANPDENTAKMALDNIPSQFACVELPIVDGIHFPELAGSRPPNVKISAALPRSDGASVNSDNTIALLNGALAQDGLEISVTDEVIVEEKISLLHVPAGANSSAVRHNVNIGAGASATIVERHLSSGNYASFSNVVTQLSLGEGAIATWVVDQELVDVASHFGQLNVSLAKDADLTVLILNSGGKLVRQEVNVTVAGENSDLKIKGVNLVGDGAHIDVTTRLDHLVPDTISSEIFRNVVLGSGHGVFQGQINVAQIAQKTDARMACNTLLLSDEAEFSAKPELEIFADDVQCAHGATVTDINDEHLFYLMARGISERDARDLLVRAFVEEVFEDLEIEEIGEMLNARIEEWLDEND